MSSTQTLSPGGEPQLGSPRFSSPMTALVAVAHPGTHPIHLPPPPMVAEVTLDGRGLSRGRCPVSRFPWMLISRKLLMSLTHNGNSPDSWLFARYKYCRKKMPPSSGGIDPVRLLPWRYRRVRRTKFLSSGGIDPVRLLLLRFSCERLERFLSSGGIDPVRLLLLRFSCERRTKFLSSGGIGPVRLLLLRDSCWRRDRLPSSDGIDPVRLLPLRCIVVRLDRLPSWVGIDPVRLLVMTDMLCNSVRFPNSAGSLPFSSPGMTGFRLPMKLILVTRGGVPATVIPCQFDTAVVAFQLRVMVPRKVSFPAQRASQSATSPVLVVGLGTVVPFRHWVNVVCPETSKSNRPDTMSSANSIVAAPAAIPHRMGRPDEGG